MEQTVNKPYTNKGHTLAGVIIFLLLVTLFFKGALSQIGSYLRVEKACYIQHSGRKGCTSALAWGLTLLETGLPPELPYSCRMVSPYNANEVFVTTFTQTAGINYSVNVRPAGLDDESLPPAPESFGQDDSGSGRPDRPGRPNRPGRPGRPDRPGKPDRPGNSNGRSNNSDRRENQGRPESPGRSEGQRNSGKENK